MTLSNMESISCLCITRKRVPYLKRALQCFLHQTYPYKQLVIVYESDDKETSNFLKTIENEEVKKIVVSATPKQTLGALRNKAIEVCDGDFFTQWDDDDFYDPQRIMLQYQHLTEKNKAACVLRRWKMYDRLDEKVYISNYMDVVGGGENTLLCRKDILLNAQVQYPLLARGEDTAVIQWLILNDHLVALDNPHLYIYEVSGNNTWDRQHFEEIFNHSCYEITGEEAKHVRDVMHPI